MKNAIIGIIKKNRFLYNLAKRINRKLGRVSPKREYRYKDRNYYAYFLNEIDEINKIQNHYKKIKKDKSNLLIIIENKEIGKEIHKLIREYENILFCDANYFENYDKEFLCERIFIMDYKNKPSNFLKHIR